MTESVLRFVDNLGITFGFALLMTAGFVIGSFVWFGWGPGHPVVRPPNDPWLERGDRADQMARMTVGEFFRRVTLGTNQGRLFLWLTAGNLALAAALPFLTERAKLADTIWLAVWPLFLFFYHIVTFWKFGSSWFSMVMLSVMALIPGWKILVVDALGIR